MLLPREPSNRVARFLDAPPEPSDLDRLLAGCCSIRLDLHRIADDDGSVETYLSYEIHGDLEADEATLAALLSQFRQPPREIGGVA